VEKGSEYCQYCFDDMVLTTLPDDRVALPLRRYWWFLRRGVWYVTVLGFRESFWRVFRLTRFGKLVFRGNGQMRASSGTVLDLRSGDWVEVRSVKEIFGTLDERAKLRGLTFTPEMVKFCGKRFRVYKKLNKIVLEATGELRRIKSPTVVLEGVSCDGSSHGGCDRSCFCFWREDWLKRVSDNKHEVKDSAGR
jgi:hypothetical protein